MIFTRPPAIFGAFRGERETRIGQGASAEKQKWTVLSLIAWGGEYLAERGFDEARLHTEHLLAHTLGVTRMGLYLQFDRPLTPAELGRFKEVLKRRLAREPLQYIVGETDFMGLTLFVDRRVLIPRPETELLVEHAVRFLKERKGGRVLDIGTGSGNIPAGIARYAPGSEVLSVDESDGALEVAAANVKRHALSGIRLERRDVMREGLPPGSFDLIVSNPPYVPVSELGELQPEVREFEPHSATSDGADGLSFFRLILGNAGGHLADGGAVMLEIGHGQRDAVAECAKANGFGAFTCHTDYAGIPRIADCRRGER